MSITGPPSAPVGPETVERLGAGWVAEEALAIGVYAALVSPDVMSALTLAVTHSGDSDSTGAIAGNSSTVYNGATQLLLVRRDRLQVEPGGFRPAVSGCYRCGWRRDEHPSAGDGGG